MLSRTLKTPPALCGFLIFLTLIWAMSIGCVALGMKCPDSRCPQAQTWPSPATSAAIRSSAPPTTRLSGSRGPFPCGNSLLFYRVIPPGAAIITVGNFFLRLLARRGWFLGTRNCKSNPLSGILQYKSCVHRTLNVRLDGGPETRDASARDKLQTSINERPRASDATDAPGCSARSPRG